MKNGKLFIWVGVIILLAVVATLSIKGCVDKKVPIPISPIKGTKDSVDKKLIESKHILDSLIYVQGRIMHEKDSLKEVAEKNATLLDISSLRLKALSKEYSLYRKYADTSSALLACDSMSNQIVQLTEEIDQSNKSNREVQHSYDSLLSTNSMRMARLEFDNSFLKEKFDKVAGSGEQLEKDNAKLVKKLKKRISIGSGIGGSIIGGKPQAVVDIIAIQYTWIKL